MLPRDSGSIVQVGSALAYRGIPLQSAYCGAKHAIQGFTESVRTELIHDKSNVRISMVQLPAVVIESDVPIVVQHTRLDLRQAENALLSTIAFSSDD